MIMVYEKFFLNDKEFYLYNKINTSYNKSFIKLIKIMKEEYLVIKYLIK